MPRTQVVAAEETYDFSEWALNTRPQPVNGGQVREWAHDKLRIKTLPPVKKRPGDRFQKGDLVRVDASKHKDMYTVMPYVGVDSEVGNVVKVQGKDVEVHFPHSGKTVVLQNANVPSGGGLFRHSELTVPEGAARFEMVYTPDPEAASSDDQRIVVELYIQRGMDRGDDKRHVSYYSGYAYFGRVTSAGGWILVAGPHQRMDPSGRQQVRSFNPDKGHVHYLGLLGHRPSGWQRELEQFRNRGG